MSIKLFGDLLKVSTVFFFILVFEICTVDDKLFTRIGKNHIRILVVDFTAEHILSFGL